MNRLVCLLALMLKTKVPVVATEYTFRCSVNGWRENANDRFSDIFPIESSQLGFSAEVANSRETGFGKLSNRPSYEQVKQKFADWQLTIPAHPEANSFSSLRYSSKM